ncbi:MAG: hypothetical protein ACE5G1_02225 [bacterium]
MRIGEIAIVGPGTIAKHEFIRAVCDEIEIQTEDLIFGRLQINEQLSLHLYGLDITKDIKPSIDLVSKKLLGYVVLFNWTNPESYSEVVSTVESLTSRYRLPVVVAANLQNGVQEIPSQMLNIDINLSADGQFTFCRLSDPASVRNVLIMLINFVIHKLN